LNKIKLGNFDIKAFVDPGQKKICHEVLYKRKRVNVVEIESRLAKKYNGIRLILNDLKQIQKWLNIYEKIKMNKNATEDEMDILRSLFISSVTTYWKSFADTKGRNRIKLELEFVDDDVRATHENIKVIRHNFTAHCGNDYHEFGCLLRVKDIKNPNRFAPYLLPISGKASDIDLKYVLEFKTLVASIIIKIDSKMSTLFERIESEID